jgi:hypothetical protein
MPRTRTPRKKDVLQTIRQAVDRVYAPFPHPISPRGHAVADALAFVGMAVTIRLLARKNRPAAAVMGVNLATESAVALSTNYPPPALLPVIRFDDHIRIGIAYAPLSLGMALLVPGIPRRQRLLLGLFPLVPFLLNALSRPDQK